MDMIRQRLLNDFQRDFPLTTRPYADLAEQLGVSETVVLDTLQQLQTEGTVSRIGPVLRPGRVGSSTLAALAVPPAELTSVAELINGYPEVNHNYEREHRYNLWFVLTASDPQRLQQVLADIARRVGRQPLSLPLLTDYHIDLGFALELA